GDWRVGGRTVHVTNATAIDQSKGNVAVGKTVDVHGTSMTDGSVNATEIKVEDSSSDSVSGDVDEVTSTEAFATFQRRSAKEPWAIGLAELVGRTTGYASALLRGNNDAVVLIANFICPRPQYLV
ncbi:MAG: hypothetical protein HY231_21785, partial [Acidobacteria bacterium]|nr:hypothetical protein [Acidobacteriota bacterium]